MKLAKLEITGYHRHCHTTILFGDATFLIGENNVGKSSILNAIDLLLSNKQKLEDSDYYAILNNSLEPCHNSVLEIIGEFIDIPEEADNWKFFKGLIIEDQNPLNVQENVRKIIIKKTYEIGKEVVIEQRSYKMALKPQFEECKTIQDYLDAGLDITETIQGRPLTYKLTSKDKDKVLLEYRECLYDLDNSELEWFKNPGGFFGNISCRLPKYIVIPAQSKVNELDSDKGTLNSTLQEIFTEISCDSPTYQKALENLREFQEEINPDNPDSPMAQMIGEINSTVSNVFLNSTLNISSDLQSDGSIKPKFTVTMKSNIETSVENQGTGLIRSAIFALLRYKNIRDSKKQSSGTYVRPLIIGFEEPEIYLHPTAAVKMREQIYSLSSSEFNQIVCTTHSPYMIDLSNKENQVLNKLWTEDSIVNINGTDFTTDIVKSCAFNIGTAYKSILDDEKSYVKMLLKMDDSVTKVFFVENALIVEGDTESVVLQKTLQLLPERYYRDIQFSWQIVRARGKAAIIPLVKYLKAMNIKIKVIHDLDLNTEGAKIFNQPILDAVQDQKKVYGLVNWIEYNKVCNL